MKRETLFKIASFMEGALWPIFGEYSMNRSSKEKSIDFNIGFSLLKNKRIITMLAQKEKRQTDTFLENVSLRRCKKYHKSKQYI